MTDEGSRFGVSVSGTGWTEVGVLTQVALGPGRLVHDQEGGADVETPSLPPPR